MQHSKSVNPILLSWLHQASYPGWPRMVYAFGKTHDEERSSGRFAQSWRSNRCKILNVSCWSWTDHPTYHRATTKKRVETKFWSLRIFRWEGTLVFTTRETDSSTCRNSKAGCHFMHVRHNLWRHWKCLGLYVYKISSGIILIVADWNCMYILFCPWLSVRSSGARTSSRYDACVCVTHHKAPTSKCAVKA